jgi:hypothetical protein
MNKTSFQEYLLQIGMKSHEFPYSDIVVINNVEYFKSCYDKDISVYNALDDLYKHLQEHKQNGFFKKLINKIR